MQTSKSPSTYHEALKESLDNEYLRSILDRFATGYRLKRDKAFSEIDEAELISKVAQARDEARLHLEEMFERFKAEAEKRGVVVHRAPTIEKANEIIAQIAADNDVKTIVKSKSMTAEETGLNNYLESRGCKITETDLGEWIIQLRGESPSHMVIPAIHLSRYQVAENFEKEIGQSIDRENIEKMVKVARIQLRRKFAEADMGISGANFAVAETGTIATVTNEGNARMVTRLPKVHVVLAGLDKLVPTLNDAVTALSVLTRNATSQRITSYVSWICGPAECAAAPEGRKIMHVVFLDNGRSRIASDPIFSQIFRCVRCGACANVCPVFRLVGGHNMGHIYVGAIGLVLTYLFHDKEIARMLSANCIGCGACKSICSGGIDLPQLIREIRMRLESENPSALSWVMKTAMKDRKTFHRLLKFARFSQRPFKSDDGYIRHIPEVILGKHGFKSFPALAPQAFREKWPHIQHHAAEPRMRIALFSGCAQDFIYPEQLEAAVKIFAKYNIEVDFPESQTCCGLPVASMGQKELLKSIAEQNLEALKGTHDFIVTLCPSCASFLKHEYRNMLGEKADQLSKKIIDFSSFVHDVLNISETAFSKSEEKVTYHGSCHLCRELGVEKAPRALISKVSNYVPCQEENSCCGFGGTYSMKFPEVSAQLLDKKLDRIAKTGAERLVADCPGCIMQLRGGADAQKLNLKVTHISELLAEQMT